MSIFTSSNKILGRILETLGRKCINLSRELYRSASQKRVEAWSRVHGYRTFRLNYDLHADSLVFDLGGYEGQWASDIFSMYCCVIHIFEPVLEFADILEQRFCKNSKICVNRFGLANRTEILRIAVNGPKSSVYKGGDDVRDVQMIRAIDYMADNSIQEIDLMKINIEGSEYDLLEHLTDTAFIGNIKNIQVQFHDFAPNAERRMAMIQKRLEKTHQVTYQYPLVWENWQLKHGPDLQAQ